MKALSIRQPWAWLIIHGHKKIENRSWNTKHRGKFYIHASKGMTKREYEEVKEFCANGLPDLQKVTLPSYELLERGGIIGKANLINTVHVSESRLLCEEDKPWFFGEYGFVLDSAQPLPFMPMKGKLGFFNADFQE